MASEITVNYTLAYKVSVDIDKARADETMAHLWEEADDDEEALEFLVDGLVAALEDWEDRKARGEKLPSWVTHFSLEENLTGPNEDATL